MAYCTLRLLGRAGPDAPKPLAHVRGIVVTITALGLWLEPVRTTFNYGQINLFLCALLLAGAVAGKEWLAGASVGLAAGIKLTPAITGLYYLLQKRWSAVVWSVVFFALTVAAGAGTAAGRDVAFLQQADLRPGPHRSGVVRDQPIPAWCDRPGGRRGPHLALAGSSRRGRGIRGLDDLGVPAGRRPCGRPACRAVHRAAAVADLLVAPLGLGAAVPAVVPVRSAAASPRCPGAWPSPGWSRRAAMSSAS